MQRISAARNWTTERAGLTLVELLVVLTIISVSLGLVVFAVGDRPTGGRLARQAERLASWIRAVTAEAAADGESWTLCYDLAEGRFASWPTGEGADVATASVEHGIGGGLGIERLTWQADGPMERRGGAVELPVFADGTCVPHLVTLSDGARAAKTLEVNPVTGDVVVFDGRRDYEWRTPEELLAELR
ncbi:MAG: prepilin-type N-terminal cleavage/methylation domain-containing protein [Longimicrobiales bacterium]